MNDFNRISWPMSREKLFNRTGSTVTFSGMLILGVGLYLNFQKVLSYFLDGQILLMIWVGLPALLFIFLVPQLAANSHRSVVAFLMLLFLFVLSFHVVVQGVRYGAIGASWAMVSYGLWLGLFSWMQFTSLKTVLWLGVSVFLGSALIHAGAILADSYYAQGFYKVVTIGEVERFYGISESASIGSMQLGVGMLVAISLYYRVRSKLTRIFFLLIFGMLIIALLVTSVRGSIIYSFLALVFLLAARFNRGVSAGTQLTLFFFGALGSGALVSYDISHDNMRWNFIKDVFSFTDAGNQGRLEQYRISIQLFVHDWWNPFVGHGAAEWSQLATAFGQAELTTESSLIKALLELGIVGLLPITVLLGIVLSGVINRWRHPLIIDNIVFFAVLFLVSAQCMTHETFKAWIGSFYFVLTLGICVRLLVEAGYLKRPVRLLFLSHMRKENVDSSVRDRW